MVGNKSIWYSILMAVVVHTAHAQEEKWSWFHRKAFAQQECIENGQKKEIAFCKYDCDLFTQLLFSWNGFRNQPGYFSFWVRARNHTDGKWGSWHKMIEWGDGVQRSFLSKSKDFSDYMHVRLEVKSPDYADAFCVKIMAHDGADLSAIKSFAVTLSDYRTFKPETVDKKGVRLPSVRIKSVPKIAQLSLDHQRSNHMCSPVSCSMLVGFLMKKDVDPLEFAKKSFDEGLDTYGSWPFNTAHAYELCDQKFWFAPVRLHSFQELHSYLQQGIPVVVSVRGAIEGAPKSYDNGHLLVVVGWDAHKQAVICHDPAFDDAGKIVKQYPIKSFLSAWERSYRLAYRAELIEKSR